MADATRRIRAIARKDFEEVRRQPWLILPAVAMVLGLALPAFLVLIIIPALAGGVLDDAELARAAEGVGALMPATSALSDEARAQAYLLQQFLMFGLVVPVLGSLSLAAQGIIGEKQSRALEPLLATPVTTTELLVAKIATPFVLSMALLALSFLVYLGGMAAFGLPGVWRTLFWPRALVLHGILAPLLSMAALGMAAIMSSRVNDSRTAQQLGGFLIVPITGLFVAQLMGQFVLGIGALLAAAMALVVVDVLLLAIGVRVFERETILMRWK